MAKYIKKTLLPIHWVDRIRQILYLLGYLAFAEYSFPTPFIQSSFGKLVYAVIVFYVGKIFWRLRQERSPRFYAKTQRWHEKLVTISPRISDYTRYRIMRMVRWAFILYAVGWLIDGTSDSCNGAVACVGNIPFMLVNNFAELLMFAIRLAMSFVGIFGMMWLMARMDLHTTIMPDAIETRFTDVYGQDKALAKVQEVQKILDFPEEVEAKGGFMPGGILLYGPPGTGKTLLAEAVAGETRKPFVKTGPESFTNMFVGVPVMKVKMLFRHLRKLSVKHGGVVVFFDEIDALGSRGGGVLNQAIYKFVTRNDITITGGGAAGSGALQMMLTEMSGMAKPKGVYNKIRVFLGFKPIPPPQYRILWMGATNRRDVLDPALLRPGRFDRQIHVGHPDLAGAIETFKGYLNRVDHNLDDDAIKQLARSNRKATGASIKDAVNEGLLKVIRERRDIITYNDMVEAMREKTYGETRSKIEYEPDQWRTAVHEAAHAVSSYYFRPEAPIQFASVLGRGKTGGMVVAHDDEEKYMTKSRLVANIKVSLASVWAEKFFFDDNLSTGPSSDLETATHTVLQLFGRYAMGSTVMVFPADNLPPDLTREAEDYLNELYEELKEFMIAHKDEVYLVAQLLDDKGTVDGQEIIDLLGRMQ